MHPSFQSSTYSHSFQAQIHGPSGLKVLAGEDLSTPYLIQPTETEDASSSYSQTFGGASNKKSVREGKR